MSRETIDFGIDLGTTNSSIALWTGNGQIQVFKNLEQSESTPSAVYVDPKGAIRVGMRAKDAAFHDRNNVFFEFKQQMGRPTDHVFARSRRKMKPEELSAEVLKSLKADVKRRLNEDLEAAVITIPAAFDKTEIYATNRAAELAGFSISPLFLEPVAAALAYG
ncbi:MAG: Hsp70 family protein, partial [Candidatus Manganitrophaceae bacterium]